MIEVDFMTEPYVAERLHPSILLTVQRDLQAVIIPGSSIVFSHNFEHEIEGILPSGAEARVTARIADVVGCISAKGLALKGRHKEKDSHDIYFLPRHYQGGPERAAREVPKHLNDPTIREAVDEIREKFRKLRNRKIPFRWHTSWLQKMR